MFRIMPKRGEYSDAEKDAIIEAARVYMHNPGSAQCNALEAALDPSPLPTDEELFGAIYEVANVSNMGTHAAGVLPGWRRVYAHALRLAADHGNDNYEETGETWEPIASKLRAWADQMEKRNA